MRKMKEWEKAEEIHDVLNKKCPICGGKVKGKLERCPLCGEESLKTVEHILHCKYCINPGCRWVERPLYAGDCILPFLVECLKGAVGARRGLMREIICRSYGERALIEALEKVLHEEALEGVHKECR